MELTPQIIEKDGKKEFVVLPHHEFLKIKEMIDDYDRLLNLRKTMSDVLKEHLNPMQEVTEKLTMRR